MCAIEAVNQIFNQDASIRATTKDKKKPNNYWCNLNTKTKKMNNLNVEYNEKDKKEIINLISHPANHLSSNFLYIFHFFSFFFSFPHISEKCIVL